MADDPNQYNDEYQLDDLDIISPDPLAEDFNSPPSDTPPPAVEMEPDNAPKSNIRRNALIVVIFVILAMLAYKFFGSFFSAKETPVKTTVPSITTATPTSPPPQAQPVVAEPVTPPSPPPVAEAPKNEEIAQINQRLSDLESGQQNMRSDISTLNNQLASISSSVRELTTKVADLNQTLTALASKVDQQTEEIAILMARTAPKPVPCAVIRRGPPLPNYYIQAVIPGRAWLIARNGSTITVREGTQLPGYGIIKLIDAIEGRVLTSSGRIIRFSQQDS